MLVHLYVFLTIGRTVLSSKCNLIVSFKLGDLRLILNNTFLCRMLVIFMLGEGWGGGRRRKSDRVWSVQEKDPSSSLSLSLSLSVWTNPHPLSPPLPPILTRTTLSLYSLVFCTTALTTGIFLVFLCTVLSYSFPSTAPIHVLPRPCTILLICGPYFSLVSTTPRPVTPQSASTMTMDAAGSSETSVNFYQITRHHIPERSNPNSAFLCVCILFTISLYLRFNVQNYSRCNLQCCL